MNDSLFFRTSRAAGEPPSMHEAVIPLALHRAQLDATKGAAHPRQTPPAPAQPATTAQAAAPAMAAPAPIPAPHAETMQPIAQPIAHSVAQPVAEALTTTPPASATRNHSRSKLYLVSRARGGVGATTFAVNLALGLCLPSQKSKRRVAIVDLDLQFGTVASSLDLSDKGGLLALAQLDHEPDVHAVRAALQSHGSGLSVLPAPRHPVPLDALDPDRVHAIIDALLSSHDAVVIDLPPALVDWQEPLLRRAERLFMVTDLAVTSIDCAKRILNTFREDAPDLPVEIIVGREKKPLFAGRLHREIAAVLDEPLRHWLPFDPKRARLALDRGEPLLQMQPHSAWSRGIRKIVGALE